MKNAYKNTAMQNSKITPLMAMIDRNCPSHLARIRTHVRKQDLRSIGATERVNHALTQLEEGLRAVRQQARPNRTHAAVAPVRTTWSLPKAVQVVGGLPGHDSLPVRQSRVIEVGGG